MGWIDEQGVQVLALCLGTGFSEPVGYSLFVIHSDCPEIFLFGEHYHHFLRPGLSVPKHPLHFGAIAQLPSLNSSEI